jgi:kynureninase
VKRDAFAMPKGIYLDGNSLGPMPHLARAAVERRLRQWAQEGVNAWEDWFDLAERLSPALARLVGASASEVVATGSITANLHALLATFYRPDGERRNLLATELDFPSDLYALRAWAERLGGELRLVPSRDGHSLETRDILANLTPDIALAWLPTVLYRSGQRLDVRAITAAAGARGILSGWDAAHSVGAMPHRFHDDGVDFAVWCHYKYVNAGPGAPAGLFVHDKHTGVRPGLPGWWGHDKASQFEMTSDFRPAEGAGAFQIGTPSILATAALEGALEVFENCSLEAIRARSLELTDVLIALVDEQLPEVSVRTPRQHEARGGHVALECRSARRISLALRERNITADFRPPNLLRLTPVALYNTEAELEEAVTVLRELLTASARREATNSPGKDAPPRVT